jgi:hypothetical protein
MTACKVTEISFIQSVIYRFEKRATGDGRKLHIKNSIASTRDQIT